MLSINKTTRIFFIKLRQFTLAALLVYASGVQADALDVYMGTGTSSASETHPNLLFILDKSKLSKLTLVNLDWEISVL